MDVSDAPGGMGEFVIPSVVALVLLCLIGCGDRHKPLEAPQASPPSAPATNESAASQTDEARREPSGHQEKPQIGVVNFRPLPAKVKFKSADGQTAFSIKPASDGAKLVDENERELARYNVREGRLKVKLSDDSVVGDLRLSLGRMKIENAEGEKLFELQRQEDGDWKLDDADEQLVYRIKVREYGFEVESADDQSLFKIKRKDDKLTIRDSADETVYSTKDEFPPIAAATLMLEKIESRPLRFGLAVVFALEVEGVAP